MPSFKQHCRNSKKRTGEAFEELHRWMDEPQKRLGINHRTERHDNSHIDFVKSKWGNKGVREFLRHIAEDYEFTAEQWGKDCIYCGKGTWKKRELCNRCLRILGKEYGQDMNYIKVAKRALDEGKPLP